MTHRIQSHGGRSGNALRCAKDKLVKPAEMDIASIIGLACFVAACFLAALTGALLRRRTVRAAEEAVLAATEPAFRPGVVRSLSDTCGCRVADLREAGFRRRWLAFSSRRFAAHSQCRVIAAFLRSAPPRSRLRRGRYGPDVHHRDHHDFLPDPRCCRGAARALPWAGSARFLAECRHMAPALGGVAATMIGPRRYCATVTRGSCQVHL
jgi:hypothetical protein